MLNISWGLWYWNKMQKSFTWLRSSCGICFGGGNHWFGYGGPIFVLVLVLVIRSQHFSLPLPTWKFRSVFESLGTGWFWFRFAILVRSIRCLVSRGRGVCYGGGERGWFACRFFYRWRSGIVRRRLCESDKNYQHNQTIG